MLPAHKLHYTMIVLYRLFAIVFRCCYLIGFCRKRGSAFLTRPARGNSVIWLPLKGFHFSVASCDLWPYFPLQNDEFCSKNYEICSKLAYFYIFILQLQTRWLTCNSHHSCTWGAHVWWTHTRSGTRRYPWGPSEWSCTAPLLGLLHTCLVPVCGSEEAAPGQIYKLHDIKVNKFWTTS